LARCAAGNLSTAEQAQANAWADTAQALQFTAIGTVYAQAPVPVDGTGHTLRQPMLALRPAPQAPAQFVFDRGYLAGPPGLLAFVVSASDQDRATLETQVMAQAQQQLGLSGLRPIKTVIEKRATFACTPALKRPPVVLAHGLYAAGDYTAGPYPATLEGATMSGLQAAEQLLGKAG
jgi:hypothetical protein